ncbi:MAG: hypothetical protein ABII00_18365 [Elusimicrobiota bacterium]
MKMSRILKGVWCGLAIASLLSMPAKAGMTVMLDKDFDGDPVGTTKPSSAAGEYWMPREDYGIPSAWLNVIDTDAPHGRRHSLRIEGTYVTLELPWILDDLQVEYHMRFDYDPDVIGSGLADWTRAPGLARIELRTTPGGGYQKGRLLVPKGYVEDDPFRDLMVTYGYLDEVIDPEKWNKFTIYFDYDNDELLIRINNGKIHRAVTGVKAWGYPQPRLAWWGLGDKFEEFTHLQNLVITDRGEFVPPDTGGVYPYPVVNLTDNDYPEEPPRIDAGRVVWQGHDERDHEIFLYDIAAGVTAKITDNAHIDRNPQIDGSRIAWESCNWVNPCGIYLHDSDSGSTTRIAWRGAAPQIDGDYVVWQGGGTSDGLEIYLRDTAAGETTRLTTNASMDNGAQIDDGQVVWQWWNWGGYNIYHYDIATGEKTLLPRGDQVRIDAGLVVWQGHDGSDHEIYLYDAAVGVTTQISDNEGGDARPQIDAGRIVWQMNDGNDWEISLHDIASGATTRLTDNDFDDVEPQIDAGRVVWQAHDGNDWEIFLYDSATGTTVQMTDNALDDQYPQIDGLHVVWQGTDGVRPEVFLATLIPGPEEQELPPGREEPTAGSGMGEKEGWEDAAPPGFDEGKKEGWTK